MSEPVAEARPRERPIERVLKAVLIALIVLFVLGGVGAEIWLRRHLHPPADGASHVFLRPPLSRTDVVLSRDVPGLAKRASSFTTNALGLRGDELDLTQHDALRIVTLGGSVTECMALDDADAWPQRLQTELARRTGRAVWVGNAARSGETTLDYIAHARLLLPGLLPDVVIVMPGGNDLQAVVEGRYFPIDLSDARTLTQYGERLYVRGDTAFLEPFYAYSMYERRVGTEVIDLAPLYLEMKRRRLAAPKLPSIPDLDEATDVYRTNLRALHAALQSLKSKPRLVLMTHPFLWHEGMRQAEEQALWAGYTCMSCPTQRFYAHQALAAALHQLNQELLRFCSEQGLWCFDAESKLPKNLENFYDDGHLKEAGAARLAQALAAFLAERGIR